LFIDAICIRLQALPISFEGPLDFGWTHNAVGGLEALRVNRHILDLLLVHKSLVLVDDLNDRLGALAVLRRLLYDVTVDDHILVRLYKRILLICGLVHDVVDLRRKMLLVHPSTIAIIVVMYLVRHLDILKWFILGGVAVHLLLILLVNLLWYVSLDWAVAKLASELLVEGLGCLDVALGVLGVDGLPKVKDTLLGVVSSVHCAATKVLVHLVFWVSNHLFDLVIFDHCVVVYHRGAAILIVLLIIVHLVWIIDHVGVLTLVINLDLIHVNEACVIILLHVIILNVWILVVIVDVLGKLVRFVA
jgi:hypothetical protein